jgi:hypothetical protein
MTSFSFRKREIITLLVALVATTVILIYSHDRGMPLSAIPFAALAIVTASVLTDAYYNAKQMKRDLEFTALERASPLLALRSKVIQDLIAARRDLTKTRAEAEEIKAANAIAQLDRESTLAIFRAASRPTKRDVWAERVSGFLMGVAGSMIASYAYSVLQAGSNA